MLLGRERELALLVELMGAACQGSAGSLMIRGEPGVGKTTLLDALVDQADGVTVLRIQGIEAEAPLPYAALHRTLRPLTHLRDALPVPQAHALRLAFGEADGPALDPFLVSMATLALLAAAAEETPMMCVAEDTQWLDAASVDALLFCARRIDADRVLMLFSSRDDEGRRFDDLRTMRLAGLEPAYAHTLLSEHLDVEVASEVAERVIAAAHGNPLALLELPSALTPGQLRGDDELPARLHLGEHLEDIFLKRGRALPEEVQTLLLLAASEDTGELDVIMGAAAELGIDEKSLDVARSAGLLVVGPATVAVRHPLVRSAIYQAASATARRRAHVALANELARKGDPDREVWHRATAAERPAPEVVQSLILLAKSAERRGAYAAAVAAYEAGSALTGDVSTRALLSFEGARNAWASGQRGKAESLLGLAAAHATDPLLRSDIARLRGRIAVNVGSAVDAHRIFVEAARAVREFDSDRALELSAAASLLLTYGAGSRTVSTSEIESEPAYAEDPRRVCLRQIVAAATSAAGSHWATAVDAFGIALQVCDDVADIDVLGNLGNTGLLLGDDDAQRHCYTRALSQARESDAVVAIVYAQQRLCFGDLVSGDWVALRRRAEETRALASAIGQVPLTVAPTAWLTLLTALQGRDDCDGLVIELEELVSTHPLGILTNPVRDLASWAKAARFTAAGDADGALHQLRGLRVAPIARMATVTRIDAAMRAEEPALAITWTDELVDFATSTNRAWALAAVSYGRAMTVADASDAESHFLQALDHFGVANRGPDEARVQLGYGEWLRRAQRRVEARVQLRRALASLDDLHAEPLAIRAREELRSSGETARRRDPSTLVQLTPMEQRIARLVSTGLSNKEVAAQCWVSPRTVAFHLRNVFAKAGISSRGELARLDLD